jgi:hypothetical protein
VADGAVLDGWANKVEATPARFSIITITMRLRVRRRSALAVC